MTHREIDVHPHSERQKSDLFHAHDGGSTEIEYLELVTAFVRVCKPKRALETGTFQGWGSSAIAWGLHQNGSGHLTTVDRNDCGGAAADKIKYDADWAFVQSDTLAFINKCDPLQPFEFAFLDSDIPIRVKELDLLLERQLLTPGAIVMIHDSSRYDEHRFDVIKRYWAELDECRKKWGLEECIALPLSRGMTILRVPG